MWIKAADGSVEDQNGKVIFFSTERFIRDIGLGKCCFICGALPGSKDFNDEHVLSEWLLRRYRLFDRKITLPNGRETRYGSYTVPCCAECNSLMGKHFEQPISVAIKGGPDAIATLVAADPVRMFAWLALIYLKTHLKDRALPVHLDQRKGAERIADEYDWVELHHIHCLVRYFYSGSFVEPEALGSFFILYTDNGGSTEQFDYSDLYASQTAMLTVDDSVMYAIMNDSGAVICNYSQRLERFTGPLSHVQSREVMAELAFLNLHVKDRTRFQTELDMIGEKSRIIANRPQTPDLETLDHTVKGKILVQALRHALPKMKVLGFNSHSEIEAAILSGHLSFLFDDNGKFITESWKPL